MTMNFGPLSQRGGERRLNVAITRARRKLEVVSSIRAADITESPNVGREALRAFLQHAESGTTRTDERLKELGRPDSFERELARLAEMQGFFTETRVGRGAYRVDVGLRHRDVPDRFVLAT